jgi:hypothetical protein
VKRRVNEIKLLFFLKGEIILRANFLRKRQQQRKIFSGQKKKKENTDDDEFFLKAKNNTRNKGRKTSV